LAVGNFGLGFTDRRIHHSTLHQLTNRPVGQSTPSSRLAALGTPRQSTDRRIGFPCRMFAVATQWVPGYPCRPSDTGGIRGMAQGGSSDSPNSPEILLTCGKASGKNPWSCWRMTERILGSECTVQTVDSRVNFRSLP
jgi:hypothetical protein